MRESAIFPIRQKEWVHNINIVAIFSILPFSDIIFDADKNAAVTMRWQTDYNSPKQITFYGLQYFLDFFSREDTLFELVK